jgi:uncharacterized cofD-like protein
VAGEAAIDVRTEHPDAEIDYVYLDVPAYPTAAAITALRSAHLVVIGPGDLYTSVVPNLLVEGIVEAIAAAQHRVFVVNLMTKPGESNNYRASTFVERLMEYLAPARLDAVIVNTATPPPKVCQRYASQGAFPVEVDDDVLRQLGVELVAGNLASSRYFMRHDPVALALTLYRWRTRAWRQLPTGPRTTVRTDITRSPGSGRSAGSLPPPAADKHDHCSTGDPPGTPDHHRGGDRRCGRRAPVGQSRPG